MTACIAIFKKGTSLRSKGRGSKYPKALLLISCSHHPANAVKYSLLLLDDWNLIGASGIARVLLIMKGL